MRVSDGASKSSTACAPPSSHTGATPCFGLVSARPGTRDSDAHAPARPANALFELLAFAPAVLVELLEVLDALLRRAELPVLPLLRLRTTFLRERTSWAGASTRTSRKSCSAVIWAAGGEPTRGCGGQQSAHLDSGRRLVFDAATRVVRWEQNAAWIGRTAERVRPAWSSICLNPVHQRERGRRVVKRR
jgi:hypothetical protein